MTCTLYIHIHMYDMCTYLNDLMPSSLLLLLDTSHSR